MEGVCLDFHCFSQKSSSVSEGNEEEADAEGLKSAPREREQIPKDIECSVDFEEIDDMLEKGLEGSVKSYRCDHSLAYLNLCF